MKRYRIYHNFKRLYDIDSLATSSYAVSEVSKPPTPPPSHQTQISVLPITAQQAESNAAEDVAILNFASWMVPGGFYWLGLRTQEESLCETYPLLHILRHKRWRKQYRWQRWHTNSGLYHNCAIVSPIPLPDNTVTVISCAAPYFSVHRVVRPFGASQRNSRILYERIDFLLGLCVQQGFSHLILGAWGCGSFGQNPEEVANIFKKLLTGKYKNRYKKVVFAIPNEHGRNYKAFHRIFVNIT